jgi:hypothetical protein
MIELLPLGTLVVDVSHNFDVGEGPAGARSIGEIRSACFEGSRLQASLASPAAADWMVRTGSVAILDVRMLLRTEDGALIFVQYGGRLDLANRTDGLTAYTAPVFETGHERYKWLNGVQAVAKGKIVPGEDCTRIDYEFYEVR